MPSSTPAPLKDRFDLWQSVDNTPYLPVVATSAMKNIYGVISATLPEVSPETALRS